MPLEIIQKIVNNNCDILDHLKFFTLSIREFPFFSHIYAKDDGVVLLIKLDRPIIDFSHISLLPTFHKRILALRQMWRRPWTYINFKLGLQETKNKKFKKFKKSKLQILPSTQAKVRWHLFWNHVLSSMTIDKFGLSRRFSFHSFQNQLVMKKQKQVMIKVILMI